MSCLAVSPSSGCWQSGCAPSGAGRRLSSSPGNPLVLFETGANGHNDAIMVLFMLAGLAALLTTRWYWQSLALPLLVASVLVKWTSVLLIPLAIIYLLRGGRIRRWGLVPLGIGVALAAGLALPVILPFWENHSVPGECFCNPISSRPRPRRCSTTCCRRSISQRWA